jgi:hypothetical protein
MVRIHEWKSFESQAREIFAQAPERSRFTVKQTTKSVQTESSVPKRKEVVLLRVTNGAETITFETTERFYVKRITALVHWFTAKMVSLDNVTEQMALKERLPR